MENLFESVLDTDSNDHVQFTVKAAFNSDVFLKDGEFNEAIYEAFKKAIDATAAALNVASPLSSKKLLSPKPDFHQKRWSTFDARQNELICRTMPNTITLTPGVTVDDPKPETKEEFMILNDEDIRLVLGD